MKVAIHVTIIDDEHQFTIVKRVQRLFPKAGVNQIDGLINEIEDFIVEHGNLDDATDDDDDAAAGRPAGSDGRNGASEAAAWQLLTWSGVTPQSSLSEHAAEAT